MSYARRWGRNAAGADALKPDRDVHLPRERNARASRFVCSAPKADAAMMTPLAPGSLDSPDGADDVVGGAQPVDRQCEVGR